MSQEALRRVPQLEKLLKAVGDVPNLPRPLLVSLVREWVDRLRREAMAGQVPAEFAELVKKVRHHLDSFALSRLQPVINGTGVLIHTNLGRSPLGAELGESLKELAGNYNNLEFDLETGERGKRGRFAEKMLAVLCGAEAATVVNNCAAALVLILRTLATGERKEVVISRGQLVEIGGGFRVPDIMETSGATLREVGATNKTSLADYRKAIGPQTAMLLRVHRSNFYMEGFVDEPDTRDLVALGTQSRIPVVEDLGSGAMVATERLAGIQHEPTPAEIIAQGVDLVCFSGDKLFGGPQAGIIVGKAALISQLKKDPFFRALRCDKLVLGMIQEAAAKYLHHTTEGKEPEMVDLPLVEMLRMDMVTLSERVERVVGELASESQNGPVEVFMDGGTSRPGGGTMPKSEIPSKTLRLRPKVDSGVKPEVLATRLRTGKTPVVGYLAEGAVCLDFRTIFPRQEAALVLAIREAILASMPV